ncbi:hypothetical protein AGABI1DRAFT_82229, partial [Agaricus bisporus var. burnettii JB137-S8]
MSNQNQPKEGAYQEIAPAHSCRGISEDWVGCPSYVPRERQSLQRVRLQQNRVDRLRP